MKDGTGRRTKLGPSLTSPTLVFDNGDAKTRLEEDREELKLERWLAYERWDGMHLVSLRWSRVEWRARVRVRAGRLTSYLSSSG